MSTADVDKSQQTSANTRAYLERLRLLKKTKRPTEQEGSAPSVAQPPAKKLVMTHTDAEQPSPEKVTELLGPAPRSVQIERAVSERAALEKRIGRADKHNEKNVYFDPAQIKARYGKKNALGEFIREKTSTTVSTGTRAGGFGTREQSSSAEQTVRIDEMVASLDNSNAANELAAAKVILSDTEGRFVKSGAKAPVMRIDDFVTRLQQAASGGALGDIDESLFDRPYFVTGLSTTEANPDWEQMQIDRQALIARRKALQEERRSLTSGRKWFASDREEEDHFSFDQIRRNELRRRLMEYQPLESIELLKPDSQVRAINLRWRSILSGVLKSQYDRYLETTKNYLAQTVANDNGSLEGLASLYLQHIVNPVFDRHLDQIRSSTYEDQPLTSEILEEYLYDFLNALYTLPLELLQDPPPSVAATPTGAARKTSEFEANANRRADAIRSLVGLPTTKRSPASSEDAAKEKAKPSIIIRQAGEPLDALGFNTAEDDERQMNVEYLRQALNIHASQIYIGWLKQWLAEATNQITEQPPDSEDRQKLDLLNRLVRKMVADREELQERRIRTIGRAIPRYTPIKEAEIRESYELLLQNEVALARAEYYIAHKRQYTQVFVDFITEQSRALPSLEMVLHPRVDIIELLTVARDKANGQAQQLFSSNRDTLLQVEQQIAERVEELIQEVFFYAPRIEDYVYFDHAPLDRESSSAEKAEDNAWSPYALAYPLSLPQTELQIKDLQVLVMSRAEQFDADANHQRANNLRSILSYDFAERSVLKSIAEINYYLEKVMVATREVALVEEITIDSTQSIVLSATIELRPELEMARRLPLAVRDPRVDEAISGLHDTSHEVTWYFTPSFGADTGKELVIARQVLPAGVSKTTYVVRATGGLKFEEPNENLDLANRETTVEEYTAVNAQVGGLYRAEFKAIGGTSDEKYKSLFKATILVVATCKRDGVKFQVGSQREHGECQWREYARDEKLEHVVDEWRILVRRGQAAFEQLLRRRRQEKELRAKTGSDYELFLPPWGAEDEQSLLRHFRASQNDESFEMKFTYYGIVQRIVDRLAGQMRRFMKEKIRELQNTTPADDDEANIIIPRLLKEFSMLSGKTNNSMALFSILAGGLRATDPMIRVTYFGAASEITHGKWISPDVDLANPLIRTIDGGEQVEAALIDVIIKYYASAIVSNDDLSAPAVFAQLFDIENTYAPEFLEQDQVLPINEIIPLVPGVNRSVESVPLATMLNTMYLPVIWPNLTWRERRFIHTMSLRFARFAREFRFVERRRLQYQGLLRNDKGMDHVAAPVSHNMPPNYTPTPIPTPIYDDFEDEINESLATITPHAAQESTTWYSAQSALDAPPTRSSFDFELADTYQPRETFQKEFLQDNDLCREYKETIQTLVRAGLLVPNVAASTRFMTVRHNPYLNTAWQVASLQTQNDYTSDERNGALTYLASHRSDWIGMHSYVTNQPDFCQIIIDPERGAAVNARGSVPVNKGYDFRGLYAALVETARAYTRIAQGEEDRNLTRQQRVIAMDKLETRLQRLELTFNFLAFVAPPLSDSIFMPVEAILTIIDDERSERWLETLRGTI